MPRPKRTSERDWKRQKEFHFGAFIGHVAFMAQEPVLIAAFEKASGLKMSARTPLDKMIDTATGRDREIAERFIKFCAKNYGEGWLPDDYLERMLKPKE